MTKPSREDVLRVAGEPVAWLITQVAWNLKGIAVHGVTLDQDDTGCTGDYWTGNDPLYTEAQLLAMYAAGSEAMRERAKCACSDRADGLRSIIGLPVCQSAVIQRDRARQWDEAAERISALPITHTNTEGEQG